MAYNVPNTGQIRLGRDFNRMRYPSQTTPVQVNMNSAEVRKHHKGTARYGAPNLPVNGLAKTTSSPINPAVNTQRTLGVYRGVCNPMPTYTDDLYNQTVTPYRNSDYWYWYEAGDVANNIYQTVTAHKTGYSSGTGTGSNVWLGEDVLHSQLKTKDGLSNGAHTIIRYYGYMEPGNYALTGMNVARGGSFITEVRGWTGPELTGSYSSYKIRNYNAPTSSFGYNQMDFLEYTTNSTYPYVTLLIQHNTRLFSAGTLSGTILTSWLNSAIPNLDSTASPNSVINSNMEYAVEPHIVRVS